MKSKLKIQKTYFPYFFLGIPASSAFSERCFPITTLMNCLEFYEYAKKDKTYNCHSEIKKNDLEWYLLPSLSAHILTSK